MHMLQQLIKLKNNKLFRLILWAILLRLLLMPFFAHPDILKTYRRSFNVVFNQQPLLSHLLAIVPHAIQAGLLRLASLFIGLDILKQINFAAADIIHINLLLFIMKLPYLIGEILFWFVLKKNFNLSATAWKWLLFNPIILYSVYVFGRYESFVLLFMALFIAAIQHQKIIAACGWLLTLLLTRFSLVLILPTLLLLKFKQLKNMILLAALVLAAGAVISWQTILDLFTRFSSVFDGSHAAYLTQNQLHLPFGITIPLFWLVLLIFTAAAFKLAVSKLSFTFKFSLFAVLILSSYYITSLFHPQYLTWFILPLTLIIDQLYWHKKAQPKKTTAAPLPFLQSVSRPLSAILSAVLNFFNNSARLLNYLLAALLGAYILILFYWNTDTTLALLFPVFAPLKFTYFSPNIAQTVSSIGSTIFSVSLFWFCCNLIKDTYQNLNQLTAAQQKPKTTHQKTNSD